MSVTIHLPKRRSTHADLVCEKCQGKTAVIDSRPSRGSIRRRRQCLVCGYRFTTYEGPACREGQR